MSDRVFTIVLGVVGAVVGFVGSGGNPMGAQLGFMIGSSIGGYIDGRRNPVITFGPRLSDLKVMSSAYGVRIPIIYGTIRIATQVFWSTPLNERSHTDGSGKGGGSPSQKTVTYTYDTSLACLICEGPIEGVTRIWMNNELVYDTTPNATPDQILANDTLAASIRVYTGSTTQAKDPTIVAADGDANTPAYRGVAYIVFDLLQLEKFGNHIPNIEVEVADTVETVINYPYTIVNNVNVFSNEGFGSAKGPYRSTADYNRKRVWASATPTTNKQRVAYLNMADNTTGYIDLQIPATVYNKAVVYVEDLDSLIVIPMGGGLNNVIYYECNPDTGAIKSQSAEWNGAATLGNPVYLYYDKYRKQLLGVGADQNGGYLQIYRLGTIPAGTLVWGPGSTTNQAIITGDLAAAQGLVRYVDLAFDDTWMYWVLSLATSNDIKVYQLDPDRAPNVSGNVFADGWTITLSSATYGLPKAAVAVNSRSCLLVQCCGAPTTIDVKLIELSRASGAVLQVVLPPTQNLITAPERAKNLVIDATETTLYANQFPFNVSDLTLIVANYDATWAGLNTYNGPCNYNGIFVTLGQHTRWDIYPWSRVEVNTAEISVGDIVKDLSSRIGIINALVNTTDIDPLTLHGYVIAAHEMTARAGIEPLACAYQFDAVESDGILKFVRRNHTPAITIPEDDYVIEIGNDGPSDHIVIERKEETELPWTFAVNYMDSFIDYQQGHQYERRLTGSQISNVVTVEFPIAMTASEAGRIVANLMFSAWEARNSFKVTVPKKYAAYEPTDVVTLVKGSNSFQARITNSSDDGFKITHEAVQQDSRNG